jgi:hypothetical protein
MYMYICVLLQMCRNVYFYTCTNVYFYKCVLVHIWIQSNGLTLTYKYILSVFGLREWISQRNIVSRVKPKIWDVIRSPFLVKHNNSMCIKDLSKWYQWYKFQIMFEINDICLYHTYRLVTDIIVCIRSKGQFANYW